MTGCIIWIVVLKMGVRDGCGKTLYEEFPEKRIDSDGALRRGFLDKD